MELVKMELNQSRDKVGRLLKGIKPWNTGSKLSEEYRRNLSLAHKGQIPWNKGKKEVVKKICLTCKKEFSFVLTGKGSKPREQKFCSKKCIKIETLFQKGHKINKGKHHSKKTKAKIRNARLKQVFPVKNTSLEIKIHELLKHEGIKFKSHYPILGQPDVFIEPNICIFADGCYWHKCFICGYGTGREKDKKITNELRRQKYTVIRVWEHDVNKLIWKKRFVKNVKERVSMKRNQ